QPPIELAPGLKEAGVSNDSLMTVVYTPGGPQMLDTGLITTVGLNVRAMTGIVWRSSGLIACGNKFCAVSPTMDASGEGLALTVLAPVDDGTDAANSSSVQVPLEKDVTKQIVLLYGRSQSFDKTTGTLSIDLRLANRGATLIRSPIKLEVKRISSGAGRVIILNADNGLTGSGAIWDVSRIVTGNRIPPGAATYNAFRLSFHVDVVEGRVPTSNLLSV